MRLMPGFFPFSNDPNCFSMLRNLAPFIVAQAIIFSKEMVLLFNAIVFNSSKIDKAWLLAKLSVPIVQVSFLKREKSGKLFSM